MCQMCQIHTTFLLTDYPGSICIKWSYSNMSCVNPAFLAYHTISDYSSIQYGAKLADGAKTSAGLIGTTDWATPLDWGSRFLSLVGDVILRLLIH